MSTYNPNQEAHYQILREMLVEARQAKGWYQKDVAERIRKDQTFVSKYEIGERKLDWIEVLSLIELFDLSEEKFLQEFRARVDSFNGSTETSVLQEVAAREQMAKARQQISRIIQEHNMTYVDLETLVLPLKQVSEKKP